METTSSMCTSEWCQDPRRREQRRSPRRAEPKRTRYYPPQPPSTPHTAWTRKSYSFENSDSPPEPGTPLIQHFTLLLLTSLTRLSFEITTQLRITHSTYSSCVQLPLWDLFFTRKIPTTSFGSKVTYGDPNHRPTNTSFSQMFHVWGVHPGIEDDNFCEM